MTIYIYEYVHPNILSTRDMRERACVVGPSRFLKFTLALLVGRVSGVLLSQQEYLRSSWNFFVLRFAYHELGCNFNLKVSVVQKPQAGSLL